MTMVFKTLLWNLSLEHYDFIAMVYKGMKATPGKIVLSICQMAKLYLLTSLSLEWYATLTFNLALHNKTSLDFTSLSMAFKMLLVKKKLSLSFSPAELNQDR